MPTIKLSTPTTTTFAQRLRARMSAMGTSQSDIARLINYTPTGVWNWLQGNTLPRAETLSALADILKVTEDWLRDGDTVAAADETVTEGIAETETLAEMIAALRAKIAIHTGYEPERVKLTLELG